MRERNRPLTRDLPPSPASRLDARAASAWPPAATQCRERAAYGGAVPQSGWISCHSSNAATWKSFSAASGSMPWLFARGHAGVRRGRQSPTRAAMWGSPSCQGGFSPSPVSGRADFCGGEPCSRLRDVGKPLGEYRAWREPGAVLPGPCLQLLDDLADADPARVG